MSKVSKSIDESKTAGASYILNFFQSVQQLLVYWANYEHIVLELKEKYGKKLGKIEDHERAVLIDHCKNLRYYSHITYVMYYTILKELGKDMPKEITNIYETIKNQYITDNETMLNYVMKMNFAIGSEIMKELLQTATDTVDSLFSKEENVKQ